MFAEREVVGTALKFSGGAVGAEGEGMQWRTNHSSYMASSNDFPGFLLPLYNNAS